MFDDIFGVKKKVNVYKQDDADLLTNLEKFFARDFKTADREKVEAALADFESFNQKKANYSMVDNVSLAQAFSKDRQRSLLSATSSASAFLEASQPLADRQKNVQGMLKSSPGLARYTSLLSGLSGDQ